MERFYALQDSVASEKVRHEISFMVVIHVGSKNLLRYCFTSTFTLPQIPNLLPVNFPSFLIKPQNNKVLTGPPGGILQVAGIFMN